MDTINLPSRMNDDYQKAELERYGTPRHYVALVAQEITEVILRNAKKERRQKDALVRMKVTQEMFDALCRRADDLDCSEEDVVRVALALFLGLDEKKHF